MFLAITGFQVFFILRDLHKNLKRLDKLLETSQDIASDIEKPVRAASDIVNSIEAGGRAAANVAKIVIGAVKTAKPPKPRFYKKIMK